MSLATRQTFALTLRALLSLWRQPWFVAITVVQPIIWLLLFGTSPQAQQAAQQATCDELNAKWTNEVFK